MTKLLARILSAIGILAATGGGSNAEPSTEIVLLRVTDRGTYFLKGQQVPESELKQVLEKLRNDQKKMELHILASSSADFQAVGRAVVAAQSARILVIKHIRAQPQP
jgi:biopolymer transport protein ExbD